MAEEGAAMGEGAVPPLHPPSMHQSATRLQRQFGDRVDVRALWAAGPATKQIFSINSEYYRNAFLSPIFNELYGNNPRGPSLEELEAAAPETVVDNLPKIKFENKMHVCGKCIRAGKSEKEARNLTVTTKFTRSLDESQKELVSCNNCGNKWSR